MKKSNRRQFLKGVAGSLGGAIAVRVAGLFPEAQTILAKTSNETSPISQPITSTQLETSELFAGFLILPEAAEVPAFVQRGRGIELGRTRIDDLALKGEDVRYDSIEELRADISTPLFVPAFLPPAMNLFNASVTSALSTI